MLFCEYGKRFFFSSSNDDLSLLHFVSTRCFESNTKDIIIYAKLFRIIEYDSWKRPWKSFSLTSSFYRLGNWGPEKFSELPEVGIYISLSRILSHCLLNNHFQSFCYREYWFSCFHSSENKLDLIETSFFSIMRCESSTV